LDGLEHFLNIIASTAQPFALSLSKGRMVGLAQPVHGSTSSPRTETGLSDEEHFLVHYHYVAIRQGFLEKAIPDIPNSSKQRYLLTARGKELLKNRTRD